MAIYKPKTCSLDNKTLDATKKNEFTIETSTSSEDIKGYTLSIVDYKTNTKVYESEYIDYTGEFYLPENVLENGNDYVVTIRLYNDVPFSENAFNTTTTRGRLLGSTKKLLIVQVPRDEELAKTIVQMIPEFYENYYTGETNLQADLLRYINLVLSKYSESVKGMVADIIATHSTINTEAAIERIVDYRQKEIFDNLKYDRFIEISIENSEYKNRIIGEETPTTDTYTQRCRIDWVTSNLGDNKTYGIVELSDDKIDSEREGFKYVFTDGTKFNLYPISGLHTIDSFFVDTDIVQRLGAGDYVMFYANAADALKAHQAGDTPSSITIKPIYPTAARIIGLSTDTGEVRIQNSLPFAPKDGYIPRFFESDVSSGTYTERKVGKSNNQTQTYHLIKGGALSKSTGYFKRGNILTLKAPGIYSDMQGSGLGYGVYESITNQEMHLAIKGTNSFPHLYARIGLCGRSTVNSSSGDNVERWYDADQFDEALKDDTLCQAIVFTSWISYSSLTLSMVEDTPENIKTQIDEYIVQTHSGTTRRKYLCIAYNKEGKKMICYYSTNSTKELLKFNPVSYSLYTLSNQDHTFSKYTMYDVTIKPPYKFSVLAAANWWTTTYSGSKVRLKENIENYVAKETYEYGTQVYYDYECLYPKTKLGYSCRPIDIKTSRLTYVKDVYVRTPSTFDCFAFTPYYTDREFLNQKGIVPKHTTLSATFVDATVSTITIGNSTYYIRTPKVLQVVDPIMYKDADLTVKITTDIKEKSYIQVSPRSSVIHELIDTRGYLWDSPLAQQLTNSTFGIHAEGRFLFLTTDKIYDIDANQITDYDNPGFEKIYFGTQKYVATKNNSKSYLYYSYDLINWNTIYLGGSINFIYHFSGKWIIGTTNGTFTSEDGLNYNKIFEWEITGATHGIDHYYILNTYGEVYISSDCKTWKIMTDYLEYYTYNKIDSISGFIYLRNTNTSNSLLIDVDSNCYNIIMSSYNNIYPILNYGIVDGYQTYVHSGYRNAANYGIEFKRISETQMPYIYSECDYDNFVKTQTINTLCGEPVANSYNKRNWTYMSKYIIPRYSWVKGEVINATSTKLTGTDYYVSTPLYAQDTRKSTREYILIDEKVSKVNSATNIEGYTNYFNIPLGYIATPNTGIAPIDTQLYSDIELTQAVTMTRYPTTYSIINGTVSSTSYKRATAEDEIKDELGPGGKSGETTGSPIIYYLATPKTNSIPIGTKIYSDINLTNQVGVHNETLTLIDKRPTIHLVVPEALKYPLYDPSKTYSSGDRCAMIRKTAVTSYTDYFLPSMLEGFEYNGSTWNLITTSGTGRMAYNFSYTTSFPSGASDGDIYLIKSAETNKLRYTKWAMIKNNEYKAYEPKNYYWIDDEYNNLGKINDIRVEGRSESTIGSGRSNIIYKGMFLDSELTKWVFCIGSTTSISSGGSDIHIGVLDSFIQEIPHRYDEYERTYINDGLFYKSSTSDNDNINKPIKYRVPVNSEFTNSGSEDVYLIDSNLEYLGFDPNYNYFIYKSYSPTLKKYVYPIISPDDGEYINNDLGIIRLQPQDLSLDNVVIDEDDTPISGKVKINGEQYYVEPPKIIYDLTPINISENLYNEQRVGGNSIEDIEPFNIIVSNNDKRLFINQTDLLKIDKYNPMQLEFKNKARVQAKTDKEEFDKIGSMYLIEDYDVYHRSLPTDKNDHIAPETPYTVKTCFVDSVGSKVYARSTPGIDILVDDTYQPNGLNSLITGSTLTYRDITFKAEVNFKKSEGEYLDTLEYILETPFRDISIKSGKLYSGESWKVKGLLNANNYKLTVIANDIYKETRTFNISFTETTDDTICDIETLPIDCEYDNGVNSPCVKFTLYKGDSSYDSNTIFSIYKMDVEDTRWQFVNTVTIRGTTPSVNYYDFNIGNNRYYQYRVIRDIDTITGYKTYISDWIYTCFDGYWLEDLEEFDNKFKPSYSEKIYLGQNGGSLTINEGITFQESISSKGKVTKSDKNYNSGTLTGILGKYDSNEFVEPDIYDIKIMLTNGKPKLLRTPKGEVFMIAINGSPTFDINYISNLKQVTITIPWVEITEAKEQTIWNKL